MNIEFKEFYNLHFILNFEHITVSFVHDNILFYTKYFYLNFRVTYSTKLKFL